MGAEVGGLLLLLAGQTACSLADYGYLGAGFGQGGAAAGTSGGGSDQQGDAGTSRAGAGGAGPGTDAEAGHAGISSQAGTGGAAGSQNAGVEAGAGGSPATGGAAGAPTGPVCPEAIGSGSDGLIDAFENGSLLIRTADGRKGRVVAKSDRSAEVTVGVEAPGRTGASALHVQSNTRLERVGGGVEVRLLETTRLCRYDAHNYTGIRFSVRGNTPLMLGLQTYSTMPADVGSCTANCTPASGGTIEPTEIWSDVEVPFTDFTRSTALGHAPVDTTELLAIEIDFGRTLDAVDVWIDDLAFY